MAGFESSTQVNHEETSSFISLLLDQEESTLEFGENTTLAMIKEKLDTETYTEVEFNNCPSLPLEELCEIIPKMNSNLRSLIIKNTSWLNDETLELFTAICHKMIKIELQGCLINITRSGIESIARNCSSLLSLSIISTDEFSTPDHDSIESDQDGQESVTSTQSWNLDNRIFPALINNMTSKLRHFSLSGFSGLTCEGVEKFLLHFHRTLRSIDFSELSLVNDLVLKTLGDHFVNLFVIKLNHCKKITNKGIEHLFPRRTSLEVLELNGCEAVTDGCFETLSKSAPKLTIIKLDWCFRITEVSLKHLSMNCKRLSYISMRSTGLKSLPCSLSRLNFLNFLDISDCVSISFPDKNIIDKGLTSIIKTLRKYDIENRFRVCALGGSQSGKTSMLLSLQSDHNVADGMTFGVPVHMWYPLQDSSVVDSLPEKAQEKFSSLSLELWDASGRKALEGIHSQFMCKQCIYLVCFNAAVYNNAEKVPKWINTIQGKHPGSNIVIVASHCDLAPQDRVTSQCERVLKKALEEETTQVREIKEELLFLDDLGLFSMIGSKRRKLERLLDKRPRIHPQVVQISSITGDGMEELRNLILKLVMNSTNNNVSHTKEIEQFYYEIMVRKKNHTLFMSWKEIQLCTDKYGITDKNIVYSMLDHLCDLGCIMMLENPNAPRLTPQQNGVEHQHLHPPAHESALSCINPPLLAEAVALLHRNEKQVQDLVLKVQREGHLDALWPTSKPNDWTLRNTFLHITENGMIRESIIPLLVNKLKIPMDQMEMLVTELRRMLFLIEGAPNANYDVELILPNMKNFSVFKRFFMPLQGLLPVIPQVNAWLPKCPPTHIQIGWDYRFVSAVPPYLFLSIISACTVARPGSETLSYWQGGVYVRNGKIDVSVCQWKDKLVLQVLARAQVTNGTRQAVNKAWSTLCKYLIVIEQVLNKYPGLYYEVLALSNSQCKPVLEVVDEFEAGDITENEALMDIPLKASTKSGVRGYTILPNYMSWLQSIADQTKIHISHASTIAKELNPMLGYLKGSGGFEVTTDLDNPEASMDSRLIICLMTASYFDENCISKLKNNIKDKKIILATFEQDISLDAHTNLNDLLLNKVKVDISSGKGSGSAYQPDTEELKKLVELCNTAVFGHGSLGDVKRNSLATAPLANTFSSFGNASHDSPSLLKKPFEQFSDIVKQYSDMSSETQIKMVASTAVAAAVAKATAEHIAKQSNPTMGAKAAARAAEVADAVAKGDSERASKAVIATAKAVDETVAFSANRQSTSLHPTNKRNSLSSIAENGNGGRNKSNTNKSTMCVII